MRSSLILVFFLFGLALCTPKYYSSELEGLSEAQQQQQQQQQQEQPQQQGEEKARLEEAERRRLSEQLGRRVESEEPTPRQEAIVILRPTVAAQASESELYDGRRQEGEVRTGAPLILPPHRSHKLAARFAVRRVKLVPIPVVAVPVQQQQQESGYYIIC